MEKNHWLYLVIITITVVLSSISGFILAQRYFGDLEIRLQTLETQYVNSLKAGQELKLDEMKVYVDKQVQEVKNQYYVATTIGLPATLAALLASILFAYGLATNMAKKRVEDAFKDPETLIKEKKKILVISPDNGDTSWIREFFLRLGFAAPEYSDVSGLGNMGNKHFDLALFNNIQTITIPVKEAQNILEHFTNARSVFYFGQGKIEIPVLEERGTLSYASAKSQLYGNLINALKYQAIL